MFEYAFILVLFIAALLVPFVIIFMFFGAYRITFLRNKNFFWGGLIGLLGVIPVLSDLTVTRGEFVNGVLKGVWFFPGYVRFLADWGARGLLYLILGFGLVEIVKSLVGKQTEIKYGGWIFLAYLSLAIPSFVSAIAGTRPFFIHFMLYQPLIFSLVYLYKPTENWLWYLKQFKNILLIYVSLSAIFGVLAPSWTTSSTDVILIPGLNFRLQGIFSHSNSLGMAALIYLVLDIADDTSRSLYRKFAWIVSFVVLVATQSKTAWVGGVTAFSLFFFYRISTLNSTKSKDYAITFIIAGIIVLLLAMGGLFLFSSGVEKWFNGLDTQTYKSLTSFTGRTNIWEITIQSWKENPLFGYGPGLWDIEYRLKYAPQYVDIVGMAHNQFIQTLGESGLIGIVGLSIYMITLIKYGMRYFSVTRGMSLALVLVFFTQSMSETPFRNLEINIMFFIHFILFVLFLSLSARYNNGALLNRQLMVQR